MNIMKTPIKILFYKMIMKTNIDLGKILVENNKSILDILCQLKLIKIRKITIKIIRIEKRNYMKMLYKTKEKLKYNKCIKIKWHMGFNCILSLTHQPQLC